MKQRDDLEKLDFYLNAKFEIYESILFSSIVRRPNDLYLKELMIKLKKN